MHKLLLMFVLFFGSGFSAKAAFLSPYIKTLPNGLTVVVLEDHRTPVVDVVVGYKVGSADEIFGKSGIAHFLEHLMFKGIPGLADNEFNQRITRWGGTMNAATSFDYTIYTSSIPKPHLQHVLEWEARRMEKLELTAEAVSSERKVVLEERSQRVEGHHAATAFEVLLTQLFWNHPYRRNVIGWQHEIEELNLTDAAIFHRQWYAPNNAVLVLAGDITPDEAVAIATRYFGRLARRDTPIRKRVREPEHPEGLTIHTTFADKRIKKPTLMRVYVLPPFSKATAISSRARDVLAQYLGGSNTSYLYLNLVEGLQLALSVSVGHHDSWKDHSLFEISVIPREGVSFEEAENALDEALSSFFATGISDDHVTRMARHLSDGWEFLRDNTERCAHMLARILATELDLSIIETAREDLSLVTKEAVMEQAQLVFKKAFGSTLYTLPAAEATGEKK